MQYLHIYFCPGIFATVDNQSGSNKRFTLGLLILQAKTRRFFHEPATDNYNKRQYI